jgi:hypothetical protein
MHDSASLAKPDHTSSAMPEFGATQNIEIERGHALPVVFHERLTPTAHSENDAIGN